MIKKIHISGCKIVYKCTSVTVTMHKYTVTVALAFDILLFFPLSTSLSLFLSSLTLTSHSLPPLLSSLLIANGFDYLISVFVVADCQWFWWMGFDNFDSWVLIGLMVARILMGGLTMEVGYWSLMVARYWSSWWWLGLEYFY